MRKYTVFFRMRFIAGLQYRAAAWAGVATQFFFGFVFIMIYHAFYASSSEQPPMPWHQLVTYLWLQQAFLGFIMLWWQDGELLSSITSGNVAYELCRPYNIYSIWFFRVLAMRCSTTLLRCVPLLCVVFLLPGDWRMHPPASGSSLLLFLLGMTLGAVLNVAVSMFIYILTFVTMSPIGARLVIGIASEFLMGAVIPVPLMPPWLQTLVNFFPFRYVSDLPFRLYSGNIAGRDALWQLLAHAAWIAGLIMLGRLWFGRQLKRVVVQGG